jgi:uncharacterized membrane protein
MRSRPLASTVGNVLKTSLSEDAERELQEALRGRPPAA